MKPAAEIEQSILLEDSSDYTSQDEGSYGSWQIKTSPYSDVSRLKTENTDRLQKRWDEIIAKYSNIDDNKESDEIDLNTGQITIDNGHLRSFDGAENGAHALPSIWAVNDDFEKELRKNKRAEKLRRQLKADESERLKSSLHSYYSKLHSLDSETETLQDNLSLLSPSPTKKHKSSSSSPARETLKTLDYGNRLITPQSSPLKGKLPSVASSPSEDSLVSPTRKPRGHRGAGFHSVSGNYFSSQEVLIPEKKYRNGKLEMNSEEYLNHDMDDAYDSYDESFSILDLFESNNFEFFSCAFYGCHFSSSSKASYRAHLLASHSPELHRIGYPVQSENGGRHVIPGDTIPKLNLHFPLRIDLPPERPYVCGSDLKSGTCQKVFTDKERLKSHRVQCPKFCSTKRQAFLCPLLGCDFMTDACYREFYDHLKNHQDSGRLQRVDTDIVVVHTDTPDSNDSVTSAGYSEPEHKDTGLSRKEPFESASYKSSQRARENICTSSRSSLDHLPKLDILDGVDFDIGEYVERDSGYSSIEELFQD